MKANLEKCKIVLVWLALMILSACGEIATAPMPISLTAVPTSADEAPYLYYYSDTVGGFIIERADGRDSFVIGQEISSNGIVEISNWSPSGKYLAWGVCYIWYCSQPESYFVIDTLGEQIKLPNGFSSNSYVRETSVVQYPQPLSYDIYFSQWFPHTDTLLFIAITSSPSLWDNYRDYFYLIVVFDVITQTELGRHKIPLRYDWNDQYRWQPESNSIIVNLNDSIYQISPDGKMNEIAYEEVQPIGMTADFPQDILLESRYYQENTSLPTAESHDRHYLLRLKGCDSPSPHGLCLIDTKSQSTVDIPQPSAILEYADVGSITANWHSSSSWLLFGTRVQPAEGSCCIAWAVVRGDGKMFRELVSNRIINWLPSHINTSNLPQNETPVLHRPVREFGKPGEILRSIAWSPDGSKIASLHQFIDEPEAETTMSIWDVQSEQLINEQKIPFTITINDVSGEKFWWTAMEQFFLRGRVENYREGLFLASTGEDIITTLNANNNQPFALSADGQLLIANFEASYAIMDVTNRTRLATLDLQPSSVKYISFDTAGQRIVYVQTADTENIIAVWDIGRQKETFRFTFTPPTNSDFYPVQAHLQMNTLVASLNGTMMSFELTSGKLQASIDHWLEHSNNDIQVSPDGNYLAYMNGKTALRIYDAYTLELLIEYYTGGQDMAWSPDSRYVATASSSFVRLWEVPDVVQDN